MPDYTIASQVKIPDAFATIGNMVNTASNMQNIQRGNVALEKERIMLGERKGIQQLFQKPDAFVGEDGQPDYNKLINEGMKVAPTTFPTMVPQIISAHKSALDAKASMNTLNAQQQASVGQYIMSLGDDKPDTARTKLEEFAKLNPQLKPAMDFAWKFHLEPTINNPEAFKAATLKMGQAAMAPSQQQSAITPSGPVMTNNAQIGMMNVNPMAGNTGIVPNTLVNNQIPLDARQTVGTNPTTGMPQTTTKDAFGNVQGVTATPTGGTPQMAPGDAQELPALVEHRTAARAAIANAPDLHQNARGILDEIDKVTATGQAGPALQKINSLLGTKFGGREEQASSFDLLGKYLERSALQTAQTMGPHTNSGLETVKAAQGSTAYNPTAIKKITKLVDANVTGTEAYQPGLEKAISAAGPQGVLATRQYQQQWGQNYDPRMMLIFNATKSGDKDTVKDVVKSLGGVDSRAYKEFVQKTKNIEALSQNGRLP